MGETNGDGRHATDDAATLRRRLAELEQVNARLEERLAAIEDERGKLRLILENMPVMVDALDADGRIVFWNRECERVTGYAAAEIVGNPRDIEMLYPDAAAREATLREFETRGADFRGWELQLTCKDGSVREVLWSNISGRFPVPGWATWAVGVDITERKEFERDLLASEHRYHDLVENMTDVVYTADPAGNITGISHAVKALFGTEADTVVGTTSRQWVPECQLSTLEAARSRALKGERGVAEVVVTDKEKGRHYIEVSIAPVVAAGGMAGT